ncbi:MAG TPA: hypothetical protein VLV54_16715 [Thermoanaerobaculia bacterium]|nr:hypothetical protein [Thermoanaerobaculia bacterium]
MSGLRRITERYRLEKLLAAGDGGSVFRATDAQTGGTVAVKLINSEGAEAAELHDRFLAACGALQSQHNSGLPRVLDFGFTTAGTAFLVTEYLAGPSFEESAAAELEDLSAFRLLITAAPHGDPEGSLKSWVEARNASRLARSTPRETVILSKLPQPAEEDSLNETRWILPVGEQTLAVPLAGADSGRAVRLDPSCEPDPVPAPAALPGSPSPVLPPLPPLPPVPAALPRPQPPGPRTKSRIWFLLGVGALAGVLILAAGFLWWRHLTSQPPASLPLPAPSPAAPALSVTSAVQQPASTPVPVESPPAEPAVPALDVAGLKANLSRALESGDLRLLRSVSSSVKPKDEAGLPGTLRKDLERARRALETEARLSKAEKASDRLEVIRQAAVLLGELPNAARAGELREQTAKALEAEVDADIDAGQYDAAAGRLEGLRQAWPEREGLAARTERIAAEKKSDQDMESLLDAAGRSEKANKPQEGLQLLADVKPSPHYADRIQDLRQRLKAQFAQLDRQAPVLVQRNPEAEYEKGKTASILLRITDDFAVKSAEAWVRAEGGQYTKIAVRHLSGADYALDVPPDLHQNKTIELYVTAADSSGHTGQLGSAERPLKMKKKGLLKSIFGGKGEG